MSPAKDAIICRRDSLRSLKVMDIILEYVLNVKLVRMQKLEQHLFVKNVQVDLD